MKQARTGTNGKPAAARPPRETDAYLRRLGERVRMLRNQRGMTRKALARHAKVSERYLAQLEAGLGNGSIVLLRRISRAIGLPVTQLVLEYATERAGKIVGTGGKELGHGVVNPRSDDIESPAQIAARVREALAHVPAAQLFLNPDCGFGTFASRPMNSVGVARAKLFAMVDAARHLRETVAA